MYAGEILLLVCVCVCVCVCAGTLWLLSVNQCKSLSQVAGSHEVIIPLASHLSYLWFSCHEIIQVIFSYAMIFALSSVSAQTALPVIASEVHRTKSRTSNTFALGDENTE